MAVDTTILYGNRLGKNTPPTFSGQPPLVSIPGYFNQRRMNLGFTEEILSKHVLLSGGTGCGKTNVFNFFMKQLRQQLKPNDVMIVFDTKGDFLRRFYRSGDLVISNSPVHSSIASNWNIYKEIVVDGYGKNEISNNANEIMRSLFRDAVENSSQPFFPKAARELMTALIIAQIRLGADSLSFKKVYFNNKALKAYLDTLTPKKVIKLLSVPEFADLSSVLSYIGDGASDQSLGVFAELQNVMQQVLLGTFAEDGRFSAREFVRGKGAKTLFIEYDLSIGETLSPMYRLLFDLALKEALGRNKPEGNVYLMCDEFRLLPHPFHLEDALHIGRELGIKLIAGIQSIEQIYETYGESGGRNLLSGFSTKLSFRSNDSETRAYISDLYGKNIVLEQYNTAAKERNENRREGKVVEDWELNDLGLGEAVIGFPFEKPFKFLFENYGR